MHYTKQPHNIVKKALNDQGYVHAEILSRIIGKSRAHCMSVLSGHDVFTRLDAGKIERELGVSMEDLF